MRRPALAVISLVLASLIAGAGPGAAHAEVGFGGGLGRDASAEWHVITRHQHRWYMAEAFLVAEPGALPQTYLAVARGTCTTSKRKGFGFVICEARGEIVPIPPEQFSMDPQMNAAHVEGDIGRFRHSVDWTADGSLDGGPYEQAGADRSGAGFDVDAGFYRDAVASATLFGVKLKPPTGHTMFEEFSLTYLDQGGGLGAGVGIGETLASRGIELRSDGTIAIRRVYPRHAWA
jgi:hypothetical protein